MPFAYEKLKGLDRDRLMTAIEPVLRAHRLEGVEAIWRTDNRGWVLYLTVERPDASAPGAGITLDVCTEVSRDLSAALDVADAIDAAYRLEVGSPGVERKLYRPADYARFRGQLAKVKCRIPVEGQHTVRGTLLGLEDDGAVLLDTDVGTLSVRFEDIESGQLVLDMASAGLGRSKPGSRRKRPRQSVRSAPAASDGTRTGVRSPGNSPEGADRTASAKLVREDV